MTRYIQFQIAAIALIIVATVVFFLLTSGNILVLFTGGLALLFAAILGQIYNKLRKMEAYQKMAFMQTQAMFSITGMLDVESPLPLMAGYTIFPDFAVQILNALRKTNAQVVVECGSGVSTVLVSQWFKQQGGGKMFSYDQDQAYAEITKGNLVAHGLSEFATVKFAPLTAHTINDKSWSWYDVGNIDSIQKIDVLIIDGPPGSLARYPAVPVFYSHLNDGAIILVDDARRDEAHAVLKMWRAEYPDLTLREVNTYKGAFILTKGSPNG